MRRDEILSLFARRQEAWRRRDAAALAADHTEDCTLTSPMAGIVSGRGTIENVYDVWFTGFPDFTLKDEELVVDEDRVVQISIISGTDTGGFMGLPPSGRAFRIPTVQFYQLRDGKISRWRTIYDFTGVLIQVGMLKAKPA
ncbi:MAG TPA: ester cyclase [Vicinamibacterales bacterium]|jgi:steroid delta-isomerase-like uncharacterized protein|nr:ester cyclase [Vicinamibacterales bacterium]